MNSKRAIPVELTNVCMIRNGDLVLVEDRTDPDWPGICFPGGHVENGESFADSVIREVREETGLTIENPKLVGVQNWMHEGQGRYLVFYYRADSYTGELTASDEGELKWVPFRDLRSMQLADGFEDWLCLFENEELSEIYQCEENSWEPKYY